MPIRAKALLPTIIFAIGLAQWEASAGDLWSAEFNQHEVKRISIVIDYQALTQPKDHEVKNIFKLYFCCLKCNTKKLKG